MGSAKAGFLTTAGVVMATAALVAPLSPAQAAGTWHIISTDAVENARLSADAIQAVDGSINNVEYRKGGEGNIEVCGFQRTERISASRQARWSSPSRVGSTLILQFRNVVDGGSAFSRLRQAYAACTPDDFAKPDRVTVKYSFLRKKKQARLVWALYTSAAKTEIQRAEGLAIKRAGGALIVTRSIVKDVPDTTSLNTAANSALTTKQFKKYKAAAFS
ncbi:MAG TPA: hypothetical protein VFX15_03945 [Actinomycetes bacterium]|nr:hypothetical protein [Actinomycetes bacterium]